MVMTHLPYNGSNNRYSASLKSNKILKNKVKIKVRFVIVTKAYEIIDMVIVFSTHFTSEIEENR